MPVTITNFIPQFTCGEQFNNRTYIIMQNFPFHKMPISFSIIIKNWMLLPIVTEFPSRILSLLIQSLLSFALMFCQSHLRHMEERYPFEAKTGCTAFIKRSPELSGVFHSRKVYTRSVKAPNFISLSPLSLVDRLDTQGKWLLARNPDSS